MSDVFTKLNLGSHAVIHVINAPSSFDTTTSELRNVEIKRKVNAKDKPDFVIAFAVTQVQLDAASALIGKRCEGDAIVWIAYPKGSSKRLRCEFNRDSGWAVLGAAGFEPVRQIAIDEDWSALRFRRVEFIKSLQRRPTMLISSKAKRRVTAAKKSKTA